VYNLLNLWLAGNEFPYSNFDIIIKFISTKNLKFSEAGEIEGLLGVGLNSPIQHDINQRGGEWSFKKSGSRKIFSRISRAGVRATCNPSKLAFPEFMKELGLNWNINQLKIRPSNNKDHSLISTITKSQCVWSKIYKVAILGTLSSSSIHSL